MKLKGALTILFVGIVLVVFSQNHSNNVAHKTRVSIPDVALLALQFETNPTITLNTGIAHVAGDKIDLEADQNSSVWLNYSSISDGLQKRKVTATVIGDIPKGVIIKVKSEESRGDGNGELGKSNGTVVLSNTPSDVISGIGSCYTGTGLSNGHQLTYQLEIDEDEFYRSSDMSEATCSVVYTLTDDN